MISQVNFSKANLLAAFFFNIILFSLLLDALAAFQKCPASNSPVFVLLSRERVAAEFATLFTLQVTDRVYIHGHVSANAKNSRRTLSFVAHLLLCSARPVSLYHRRTPVRQDLC